MKIDKRFTLGQISGITCACSGFIFAEQGFIIATILGIISFACIYINSQT